MTELPIDAIQTCIRYMGEGTTQPKAKAELEALINENADLHRTVRALEVTVIEKNEYITELRTMFGTSDWQGIADQLARTMRTLRKEDPPVWADFLCDGALADYDLAVKHDKKSTS